MNHFALPQRRAPRKPRDGDCDMMISWQSIKQVLLSLDARSADRQDSHLPSFPTLEHDRQFCSVEPKLGLSFL
jgi:hypothetical protein